MSSRERPLAPHLQVYRPQLTSILSIIHRLSGVALSAGTLLLVYWLASAAYGPEAFATAQGFMGSWLGYVLLFGWSITLFYHLANGIRHMTWDIGYGFSLESIYGSGWAVLVATTGLTLLTWIVGLALL